MKIYKKSGKTIAKLSYDEWKCIGKESGWDMRLKKEAKWGKEDVVNPSEKGKYDGKTKADLKKMLRDVKEKQESYKESHDGKAKKEYTDKIKELNFAIRAKSDWGEVE